MSLATQFAATQNGQFVGMVQMAMISAAINISSEQTVLSAGVPVGVVTSLPVTVLTSIASDTVLQVGGDLFTTSAAVTSGATSIPVVSSTTINPHYAGELVTPPTPVLSTLRLSYARRVLNNPTAHAALFAVAVAAQGFDITSTDAQINNSVASVWNALIGA